MASPRVIAGTSIAVTVAIGAVLWFLRQGVQSPFELPAYRHQLLFQDFYVLGPFLAILAAALLVPVRAAGLRLARWCGERPLPAAALATALLALGAHLVFRARPLVMDEVTVLFQSESFAAGALSGQLPPALIDWLVPGFFRERFFRLALEDGQIASAFWPGFALLLTPFTALGVPWVLNPLLGGATVLVMHRLALVLLGSRESAGLAVLLTVASAVVAINGMTYYAMPAHLLANGIFALLLLSPTPGRAALAGLLGSLALVLHNPVPHLLFALPWVAWLAWRADRWRLLPALFAGYAPLCLLLGVGWSMYLAQLEHGSAQPGAVFLQRLQTVRGWTSSTGLASHLFDLFKLWLWAVPALLVLAAVGAWERRGDAGAWRVLGASALLTYFGYFLVQFDQGHGWGFRYFHSAWLALPLFAVAALARPERQALAGYAAGCALLSLAVLLPFRALQAEHYSDRHHAQAPTALGDARIVIVNPRTGYYNWDLVHNDPFLRGPRITMISRGAERDREMMARHFPQYRLLGEDPRGSVWGEPR